MEINLKGVLSVEYHDKGKYNNYMIRSIYYAEPVSLEAAQNPKNWVDSESQRAEWVTLDYLKSLDKFKNLRGPELMQWAEYLENGGHIYPTQMFDVQEGQGGDTWRNSVGVEGSASFTIQDLIAQGK